MCEDSELLIFFVSGRSDGRTEIDNKSSPSQSEDELIIDAIEIEP